MAEFEPAKTLRKHRPLLLAMETVGWLHMAGKANARFLREHGGQKSGYDYTGWHTELPQLLWAELLQWLRNNFSIDAQGWPATLTDFICQHTQRNGVGLLGLLQAGHGMASGIEKNLPGNASKYLAQDATHLWLSSAFGHPQRNLLADPPEILTDAGWQHLIAEIERVLTVLKDLGSSDCQDVQRWWVWRQDAIGPQSLLRTAFQATLAETRLPNNDVTLWDQSYVAAALFKSAVAGAVLEGNAFSWTDNNIKQTTKWRLLTVGIGADHYEARAVRIGDWTGGRLALDDFFGQVRKLIEVDLAVGSLLYADGDVQVFSFPGERDNQKQNLRAGDGCKWLQEEIDGYAEKLNLEMPPVCRISEPTRSLVPMTKAIREVRAALTIPVHRPWEIKESETNGHVCPVCLVRLSGSPTDKQAPCKACKQAPCKACKQAPCKACKQRRRHRLDHWLHGKLGSDTIWISEVADHNDRLALLTLSVDIEPWLDGAPLDSLRTQAIPEWRRHNPTLSNTANPIDPANPHESLVGYVTSKLATFDKNDPVLQSLQDGYRHASGWQDFFDKIVKDRADAPSWDKLKNNDARAARWLVHQLFVKLASPGRVYRFWRQTEEFFTALLGDFREIASADADRWRVRRLILKPNDETTTPGWQDREVYNGRWRDAPISLLYRQASGDFLTACNLARLLRPEERGEALKDVTLRGDDGVAHDLTTAKVSDAGTLGTYHPVIPLDLSPARFRVLMPLAAASACVEHAIAAWNEQFARVWDRLPLRLGLVAFPREVPFQAVIEAARNLEHDLDQGGAETWRVRDGQRRDGVVALHLERPDGRCELRTVPVALPGGREDAFYPYSAVEDGTVRFPRDFQHPDGRVFRHVLDLGPGDGITVAPARMATLFLDSTARRFDTIDVRPLAEWPRMRAAWRLIANLAPSLTALRGAWAELLEKRESWCGPAGEWLPDGREAWLALVHAVLSTRLGAQGATLDHLVEAAADGSLAWAVDWHLSVLKERLAEVAHAG